MYRDLLDYMSKLENCSINLLFDRTFFTEENYCRLGYKEYSFSDIYDELLEKFSKLDFKIYYVTLYLEDESVFEKRLDRKGKVELDYLKFKAENSIKQQREYLKMAEEIKQKYPNIQCINIENNRDFEEVKVEIDKIINDKV